MIRSQTRRYLFFPLDGEAELLRLFQVVGDFRILASTHRYLINSLTTLTDQCNLHRKQYEALEHPRVFP